MKKRKKPFKQYSYQVLTAMPGSNDRTWQARFIRMGATATTFPTLREAVRSRTQYRRECNGNAIIIRSEISNDPKWEVVK